MRLPRTNRSKSYVNIFLVLLARYENPLLERVRIVRKTLLYFDGTVSKCMVYRINL